MAIYYDPPQRLLESANVIHAVYEVEGEFRKLLCGPVVRSLEVFHAKPSKVELCPECRRRLDQRFLLIGDGGAKGDKIVKTSKGRRGRRTRDY